MTTRRDLLRSVAGTSVLLSGVVRGTDRVTIPLVVQGNGRVVADRTVPNGWYEELQNARDARKRVRAHCDRVRSVNLLSDKSTYDGMHGYKLRVRTDGDCDVDIDRRTAAEFEIEVESDEQPHLHCDRDAHDCVPAGGRLNVEQLDESKVGSTGACPVYYDGTEHYLTCAHIFWNERLGNGDCYDLDGHRAWHGIQDAYIGTVNGEATNLNHDFALIEQSPASDIEGFTSEIIDGSGEITGHVTEDGIEVLKSNRSEIHGYGQTTCAHSGGIEATSSGHTGLCSETTHTVAYDFASEMAPGDSGGIIYHQAPDGDIGVIGLHRSSAGGVPAYLLSAYGITFDTVEC